MSEIEALLELYGAIDRAVVAGEVDSAQLAPLLGAYRDGGAVGWYDGQFLPWIAASAARAEARERAAAKSARKAAPTSDPADEPARATLASRHRPREAAAARATNDGSARLSGRAREVHHALSGFDALPIEGRMASRRLLAITTAARAFPQHFGVAGSHAQVARSALVFEHPGVDPTGEVANRRAADLHDRLHEQFTSMSDWSRVINDAVDLELLPKTFRAQAVAAPCTGRLIMRPQADGTDPDPCTVMEAEFITNDVTFDDAKRYLHPSNWRFEGSLWCTMAQGDQPVEPHSWIFHETVATSCPPTPGGWSATTDLQFWFSHPTPTEARVEYDLAPGLPGPYSDIEVDEGSLRVIALPDNQVQVKTTKRVRFAGSFDGPGLAMFMCATGYSTILEDMVFSVAEAPTSRTKPFPVPPPQGGVVNPPPGAKQAAKKAGPAKKAAQAAKKAAASSPSGDAESAESLDAIVAEAAELVSDYLKDYAGNYKASLEQIQAGTYKVEDAWADGIQMWSTYMSGMAKAFDLSTRAAKTVGKKADEA
ncbi:MAG: hypothetical protein Q8K72_18770 [Acidimicrobiales bacterium]|nr:hypothetical protein [Acidimicrobiales bacterium]